MRGGGGGEQSQTFSVLFHDLTMDIKDAYRQVPIHPKDIKDAYWQIPINPKDSFQFLQSLRSQGVCDNAATSTTRCRPSRTSRSNSKHLSCPQCEVLGTNTSQRHQICLQANTNTSHQRPHRCIQTSRYQYIPPNTSQMLTGKYQYITKTSNGE